MGFMDIITKLIPVIVIILILLILASNIRVVQQSRAYVIERLGAFQTVWGVGLHFKIPFIERVVHSGDSLHRHDPGQGTADPGGGRPSGGQIGRAHV